MSKEIITAPALDSLMADILPMTPAEVTTPIMPTTPEPLAEPESPTTERTPSPLPDRGDALAHLYNITEAERTLFADRRRFNIELSDDVAFILRTVSSHQLPQGLVVSAILRHYITHHLEAIKTLLSKGPSTASTIFHTETISAPGQTGGETSQRITPSGDAYSSNTTD
ncbi:MAG: hypothetical protein NC187_07645 [Candidatus Amulumruptor caecigallinarius]|nr:hypothetical protein [Candidatus Amulumruptor caecigallinarius]MCM1397342.1 hypothetical protein [Candidatus Amulumruptor caecigallinarius]MCM1453595.1 hypothetical protein [bacterium]